MFSGHRINGVWNRVKRDLGRPSRNRGGEGCAAVARAGEDMRIREATPADAGVLARLLEAFNGRP